MENIEWNLLPYHNSQSCEVNTNIHYQVTQIFNLQVRSVCRHQISKSSVNNLILIIVLK